MKRVGFLLAFLVLLSAACGERSPVDEMERLVPVYQGATVLDKRHIEEHGETIIQYEIEVSKASEDDVIELYTAAMEQKGWKSEDIKRWPGNGSVFSMIKRDHGTLTVQTITKNVKETGKIRVVLNLTGT